MCFLVIAASGNSSDAGCLSAAYATIFHCCREPAPEQRYRLDTNGYVSATRCFDIKNYHTKSSK